MSWYPGVVESGQPGQHVHGEVYALDDPGRAFAWLDEYEGIVAGSPNAGEYERLERPARLASGGDITAWVYLYRGEVEGLGAIPDGRWTAGTR